LEEDQGRQTNIFRAAILRQYQVTGDMGSWNRRSWSEDRAISVAIQAIIGRLKKKGFALHLPEENSGISNWEAVAAEGFFL